MGIGCASVVVMENYVALNTFRLDNSLLCMQCSYWLLLLVINYPGAWFYFFIFSSSQLESVVFACGTATIPSDSSETMRQNTGNSYHDNIDFHAHNFHIVTENSSILLYLVQQCLYARNEKNIKWIERRNEMKLTFYCGKLFA